MKIPEGMTEQEVLEVINKIVKRLAPKFVFGYFDVRDIEQEASIIAMDGLERYDPSRPLENFLSVHISNRLKSFKRDNYFRQEGKCTSCGNDGSYCEKCEKRRRKLEAKKNIMEPIDIDNVQDNNEKNMRLQPSFIANIEMREIKSIIDLYLPVSLRTDYLKMLDGVYVPKQRKDKIEQEILEIVEEHGHK